MTQDLIQVPEATAMEAARQIGKIKPKSPALRVLGDSIVDAVRTKNSSPLCPCPFCSGPPVVTTKLVEYDPSSTDLSTLGYMEKGKFILAYVFCHECGAKGPSADGEYFVSDAEAHEEMMPAQENAVAQAKHNWQQRNSRHRDLYEANLKHETTETQP